MARTPKATVLPEPEELNFYGLQRLGFDEIPLADNWIDAQRQIESICFRIGHRVEEGGLGKFQHFKNYVDLTWNHPARKSNKIFVWNEWSERPLRKFCVEQEVGIAGAASSGKSSSAALWIVANYLMDPTHIKALALSTTIKGAKDRVWKEIVEFWEAAPHKFGKFLKSTNEVQGLNFDESTYGYTSGIFLHAAEKSSEAAALNALIGTKAPKSGQPEVFGNSLFERLVAHPNYSYLRKEFPDEDYLRDLIFRLQAFSEDRIGTLIVVIDEATGVAEAVLNAILSNIKPSNDGHVQIIVLSNPASVWDSHGIFCEPDVGWGNVTVLDDEWRTKTGGVTLRFDGEKSPRIILRDDRFSWMQSKKAIQDLERKYGRESPYYYRMVRAFWPPSGSDTGAYSTADFLQSGAMEKSVVWGFEKPVRISGFDPAYTSSGDRAFCWFALLGRDALGKHVLFLEDEFTVQPSAEDKTTPVPHQMARLWRDECRKRGVRPENACFDATGGGVSFASIVSVEWSPLVQGISSGGKASAIAVGGERHSDNRPVVGTERFANKCTEMWMGALPYLRGGQIRGVTNELAKEVCARQYDKGTSGDARVLRIESKRDFKSREKGSPDCSDAFFLVVEHAKTKHGFRPDERPNLEPEADGALARGSWQALKDRARGIKRGNRLRK